MSRAAEEFVETLPVKGSALELLRTIAKRIPEGQTTTPPLTTDELAAPAKQSEKTVRRNRDACIRDKVICVHDGGRGNVARYEILNLVGERPITAAPLPLIGRPKPRRTKEQRSTLVTMTNLFDETSVKVTNDRDNWWARIVNVGQNVRRCIQTLVTLTNDRAYALGQNVRRFVPPWRRLARARDVHTLQEHTHTAPGPRDDAPEPEKHIPRPPAPAHPWHAWSPPPGTIGVCVPNYVHQDWLQKGYEPEWLSAFYARTCATLSAEEARRAVDEIKFWRMKLAAELADAPPARARPPTSTRRGAAPMPVHDYDAPEAIARRQRQDEGQRWLEEQEREACAVIDAMTPGPLGFLRATAEDELASFKAGMTPAHYQASLRAAMIRLVVEARQRERKSG